MVWRPCCAGNPAGGGRSWGGLSPGGMGRPNGGAGATLEWVDGRRSAAAIVDELARRFPEAAGIEADILEFLEVARERFWIELR